MAIIRLEEVLLSFYDICHQKSKTKSLGMFRRLKDKYKLSDLCGFFKMNHGDPHYIPKISHGCPKRTQLYIQWTYFEDIHTIFYRDVHKIFFKDILKIADIH